jgi:L-2-amino-thiazoline-4-carboxylic acid hydrolase
MEDTAATVDQLEADLAQARAETRSAFENRAHMYAYIYEELLGTMGKDAAVALMKRAIYRRGLEVGRKYRPAVESADLIEVGSIFCEGSPCQGGLFEPGIEQSSKGHIVLRMTACPLVDAWHGMGLPADEVDTLCDIAAAVDEGTFAGAGLDLEFLSRIGTAGTGQCLLDLTLPTDE